MPPAFSRSVDDREDRKGSKFGAALSPLESAAPISTPVPHSPEVGVAIFYNDLQSPGETQKQLVLRIFVNCCCQSTRTMYARKQSNSISFGHGPHARHLVDNPTGPREVQCFSHGRALKPATASRNLRAAAGDVRFQTKLHFRP
jgi:hypothetical protein